MNEDTERINIYLFSILLHITTYPLRIDKATCIFFFLVFVLCSTLEFVI